MKNNSRYLSLLLRHKPEKENLIMDKNGWVEVQDLITKLSITKKELDDIVKDNNKQRFEYNGNETSIRARQGHSKEVDVELKTKQPPRILYHGTSINNLKDIKKNGLSKMNRLHVHLSSDAETAITVGKRKGGETIKLTINAGLMYFDGFNFYLSNNGVWLTDNVPSKYIVELI